MGAGLLSANPLDLLHHRIVALRAGLLIHLVAGRIRPQPRRTVLSCWSSG
ncbi:MAG: hypothetical protein U1F61_20190 [Opitutaceae bacterium]